MTQAHPLAWPIGWPRTTAENRDYGRFSADNRKVSIAVARDRIVDELRKMGVDEYILSSDLALRNDGLPRSGQVAPADPGAAVYFRLGDRDQVIPCDKYTRVEQNFAAIAATIAALRTLERHGSGIMERAFTGFQALPNPDNEAWYIVLGVAPTSSLAVVEAAYKRERGRTHPDRPGGSDEAFNRVAKAWNQYKATII